jgi:hypothetical protein
MEWSAAEAPGEIFGTLETNVSHHRGIESLYIKQESMKSAYSGNHCRHGGV